MYKKIIFLLPLLAAVILVLGLYSIFQLINIKYKGKEIIAVVTKVSYECDKYNSIEVKHEAKSHTVSISRQDCRNKKYKVGQKVTLLKYKDNETLVWPEAQYQW